MKKDEVLKYCKEKSEEGWITHLMILEIYDNGDEISDEIIDLICHVPQPPKPFLLMLSVEGMKEFKQAIEGFGLHLMQSDMVDKFKKTNHDN